MTDKTNSDLICTKKQSASANADIAREVDTNRFIISFFIIITQINKL